MFPNEDEIKTLKDLVKALGIIEAASRRLCRREVNLAKADRIYEWMLKRLGELKSNVSERLKNEVEYHLIFLGFKTVKIPFRNDLQGASGG